MASAPTFRLIVRRGPQPNQIYELSKDVLTLGRDITNDIVVSDPEVSRHHARLSRVGTGYSVEDLGSTNGVFVSGQRVRGQHALSHGDMLGIGETVLLAYEALAVPAESQATLVGSAAAAPPAARPGPAPPMADEEEAGPVLNRSLVIGCVVVLVLACGVATAILLITGVWCSWIPGANEIPYLCAAP
jgi:hypothetical protein